MAESEMLRVSCFDDWSELGAIRSLWNDLLAASSARTIFLTREWLESWWKAYGGGRELTILAFFQDDKPVALAPLYRVQRQLARGASVRELCFVGDSSQDSYDLDLIVREGSEAAVVEKWLEWLCEHRSDWDALNLYPLPSGSPVEQRLLVELEARHWRYCQAERPHLVRSLPESWEAFLASLSRNSRWYVQSRLKRLERQYEIRLRRCDTTADLHDSLEQLFRLHESRWQARGQRGVLHVPQRQVFYGELARELLAQGWLDFWLLEVDGSPVAAQFGARYYGTHYFLQGGFDPAHRSASPGVVLRALIFQELIRAGVRRYDFLAGDDPYKFRWGVERQAYHRLYCVNPYSASRVARLIFWGRRTKERLRARFPRALWVLSARIYRHFAAE